MDDHTKENPGAADTATGHLRNQQYLHKPNFIGDAIGKLSLEESLGLKPRGWFKIDLLADPITITVNCPGQPENTIICASPGHANQLRQELSDAGMAGLIKGGFTWPNP